MTYYESDDTNKKINHQDLPNNLKSLLLTKEIVKKKLESDSSIQISLEKWENILRILKSISSHFAPFVFYEELSKYIGYETCALCLESIEKFIQINGKLKTSNDKCSMCLLAEIESCTNKNSVYEQIEKILAEGKEFNYSISEKKIHSTHQFLIEKVDLMIQNIKNAKHLR